MARKNSLSQGGEQSAVQFSSKKVDTANRSKGHCREKGKTLFRWRFANRGDGAAGGDQQCAPPDKEGATSPNIYCQVPKDVHVMQMRFPN